MSAEQVLRAKIVKQREGFSYEDLALQIAANETYRTFCRLGAWESWSRSTRSVYASTRRPRRG